MARWFRLILSLVGVRCCFWALSLRVEIWDASQKVKVGALREKSSLERCAKSEIRDGSQKMQFGTIRKKCSLERFAKSEVCNALQKVKFFPNAVGKSNLS